MKHHKVHLIVFGVVGLIYLNSAVATSPFITDQFTADPTAWVFEGRIYVHPSHDIPHVRAKDGAEEGKAVVSKLANVPARVRDLVVVQRENNNVDLDWISFA